MDAICGRATPTYPRQGRGPRRAFAESRTRTPARRRREAWHEQCLLPHPSSPGDAHPDHAGTPCRITDRARVSAPPSPPRRALACPRRIEPKLVPQRRSPRNPASGCAPARKSQRAARRQPYGPPPMPRPSRPSPLRRARSGRAEPPRGRRARASGRRRSKFDCALGPLGGLKGHEPRAARRPPDGRTDTPRRRAIRRGAKFARAPPIGDMDSPSRAAHRDPPPRRPMALAAAERPAHPMNFTSARRPPCRTN